MRWVKRGASLAQSRKWAEREVEGFVVRGGGTVKSGGFREMWDERKALRLICNWLETGRWRSLSIGRDTGAEA